jgi:hypothetical protein
MVRCPDIQIIRLSLFWRMPPINRERINLACQATFWLLAVMTMQK